MTPSNKILLLEITLSIAFVFLIHPLYPEGTSSIKWWIAIIIFNTVMQLYKKAIKDLE
jgi:hypothetical protein